MNTVDYTSIKECILDGNATLGIELGSTRIKTVLIDKNHQTIATGNADWENKLKDRIWTYDLDDIWNGLASSYLDMSKQVQKTYGITLTTVRAIGISAMMHGYMAFDKNNQLLVPFRTWRNTNTGPAASALTELFRYNIPQRWSIAHLYQSILNNESHVASLAYITTLSGYIHMCLTGQRVLGIGDASGMFPIDISAKDFNKTMISQFNDLVADKNYPWKLEEILPTVLCAGEYAGVLSEKGAAMLDPSGHLTPGIPLCPPEGDAGTGMVATNSVTPKTGNVSAGTSVFAMIVLEHDLKSLHTEIDMVTTPSGDLVAMAHANNCTSDINAWVRLFKEFADLAGYEIDNTTLYSLLYNLALKGEADCGGLLSYGYYSGENILPLDEGRPLFIRTPDSHFNLANFMRTHLYAALAALKIGMDILKNEEHVQVNTVYGHGGFFKTPIVGQRIMAAAMGAPITVRKTAGEGGAWGIAVLASYLTSKESGESLGDYLSRKVFFNDDGICMKPLESDIDGFETFIKRFKKGLPIEQTAINQITF